jgi:hypothetical protein
LPASLVATHTTSLGIGRRRTYILSVRCYAAKGQGWHMMFSNLYSHNTGPPRKLGQKCISQLCGIQCSKLSMHSSCCSAVNRNKFGDIAKREKERERERERKRERERERDRETLQQRERERDHSQTTSHARGTPQPSMQEGGKPKGKENTFSRGDIEGRVYLRYDLRFDLQFVAWVGMPRQLTHLSKAILLGRNDRVGLACQRRHQITGRMAGHNASGHGPLVAHLATLIANTFPPSVTMQISSSGEFFLFD